jgi:magnesium transporter
VFLPLTLIASLFGTNLDYSPFGLTFAGGFYVLLAVMLVIAVAMILYFRARKWF